MKILYVCNDLDYFRAHRGFLADAMVKKGWEVVLSTGGVDQSAITHNSNNVKILDVSLDRHKLNLKSDLGLISSYRKQIQNEKPDVVHAITIKPVLFIGIALLINKIFLKQTPKLILTFPGLGRVFEPDKRFKARLRKFLTSTALRISNRILKPHATFENYSNMEELSAKDIISSDNSSVVMGAGIDKNMFFYAKRKGNLCVLFASRLLMAKGLGEYIEAVNNLRTDFPDVSFKVAGKHEKDNPDSYPLVDLQSANNSGAIDYLGEIKTGEMPELLRLSDIHVAPSKLQEGLPRAVLEAASCGCCIIASHHEMLQKFMIENETGWLMDKVNSKVIEEHLRNALSQPEKTRSMGKQAAENISNLPVFEENLIAHFQKLYAS